jgi:hypothetical protein
MTNEIEFDDTSRRAGRWATITSILAAFLILMFAAFAYQFARRLGIPTELCYGLAGVTGALVFVINLFMENIPAAVYHWLVVAVLILMAVQTVLQCVFAHMDGGFSGPSLAAMGLFVAIFAVTALSALRLKVLQSRI